MSSWGGWLPTSCSPAPWWRRCGTLWRSKLLALWGCRAESLPSTASRSVRSTTTPTGGGSGTRATTTARRIICAGAASGADLVGGRPALWQLPIPPHTNEMGCFVAMFDALRTPTMRCLKSSPSMPA